MKRTASTLITDAIILGLCIAAILWISGTVQNGGSGYLQVQTHDSTYRYTLATDREIHVEGPLGETFIIIEDGKAHIHDSACPTKSCTQQKPIFSAHGWIACLPNQVLLTIVGEQAGDKEVDDVTN